MTALALGAAPGAAQAARSCDEPEGSWQRATPAEAGMDARKLQDALDYGTSQAGFALRVYRRGCLVGEDRLASTNRNQAYESWSMAKSVTSMIFGRAMTEGLISPDDPVGSLVPEADGAHGTITMRDLLNMTSGLKWNGWRDYNVFTMPDRVRDALTLQPVHPPGTYYEYAQSPVSLLAEAIGRAVGTDVQRYAERELMGPLGIAPGSWSWERDDAGHVAGFYGVGMRPDDFGRLGELLRRDGQWRGRTLLYEAYMRQALDPSPTNGCYGWLIWLNAGKPCIGPTITDRPVIDGRDMPDLPRDMYRFSGLFGQLVAVFPRQSLMIVRTGQDPNLISGGGSNWERELYRRVLASITDEDVAKPGDPEGTKQNRPDTDYGFQTALREPDQYSKGFSPDPLPAAGPARARAAYMALAVNRASRAGRIAIRLGCPPRWPAGLPARCVGTATLEGTPPLRYQVDAGQAKDLRFTLPKAGLRALKRAHRKTYHLEAVNEDTAGGTTTRMNVTVAQPNVKKKKRRSRGGRRR